MLSRTLNAAIDFFALRRHRLLPGNRRQVGGQRIHASSTFCVASPSPMFMTIFSSRGTAIGLLEAQLLLEHAA
jgi:hypothetical protein